MARAGRAARPQSLDVAAGGAAGALLAAHLTGARLPPPVWPLLIAAIWVAYTLDHLLDARRIGARALSHRHRFHARHAARLWCATLLVALVGLAVAVACLPRPLLVFGLVLGVAIAGYLAAVALAGQPRGVPKELVAAALYTAGIWGAPLLLARPRSPWIALALALHALAAALNLLAYAVFEQDLDERQGSPSLARAFGAPATRRVAVIAAGLGLTAAATGLLAGPRGSGPAFAVLGLLVAFPAAMLSAEAWFARASRYRVLGDLVFLLAALPWLLARLGA